MDFVLAATLSTLSRDEASKPIREAGANVSGSVSQAADCVLAGELDRKPTVVIHRPCSKRQR